MMCDFLAALKQLVLVALCLVCSVVGLFSLCHIPCFHHLFYYNLIQKKKNERRMIYCIEQKNVNTRMLSVSTCYLILNYFLLILKIFPNCVIQYLQQLTTVLVCKRMDFSVTMYCLVYSIFSVCFFSIGKGVTNFLRFLFFYCHIGIISPF